jgi:hypothetical protein
VNHPDYLHSPPPSPRFHERRCDRPTTAFHAYQGAGQSVNGDKLLRAEIRAALRKAAEKVVEK